MSIYYSSSKIASLLGYNYYTNLEEYIDLFVSYLYKNAEDLKERDECLDYQTCEETMKDKILNSNVKEDDKKKILQICDKDIHELGELKDNTDFVEDVVSKCDATLASEVMPILKSKLNCSFGTNTENKAVSLFQNKHNLTVVENNDRLLKMKCDDFYICGKIDGKVKVGNIEYLVEIKNRKNKFFKEIPTYELIQIILYTELCKNKNVCFIQKLGKKLDVRYMRDVGSDGEIFKEIMERLNALDSFIINLRNNDDSRKKFIKMSKIRMYIYIKNSLGFLPYKKP